MRMVMPAVLIAIGLVLPLSVWAQGEDALTVAAQRVAERFVQAAEAKRGEVAEIDATTTPVTLYVGLGTGDGILEGQILEVVAMGDPIIIAGEAIGFKETPVAIAEVVRVQGERLCIATVKRVQPGQQPAKGNMAYVKSAPTSLAVSTFLRPDKSATLMGQEFADKLEMALQTTGRFRMVERTRLEAALDELRLGLNDLFDPTKAARLGQHLQAKGVVLGTITQQNDRYSINVRVVDIETGTQVLTAATTCGRSDELDKKYSEVIDTEGGITIPPPPAVVKLFDAFTPITTGGGFHRKTLGTCSIGGRLYDECVGFENAYLYAAHVIFDLKDSTYTELRATCGAHDTDRDYGGAVLKVQCDGRTVFEADIKEDVPPKQLKVDLKGVRQLRIDFKGHGVVVPGDFQLVR